LRITENNTAYDSIIPAVNIVNGAFTYPDLTLANYLFVGEADESIYIPTYAESGFLWDEADTVFLRENDQILNVNMVLDPDATTGPGSVGGIFEEDIPDDARIEARRRVRRVGVALRRRRSSNRTEDDEFELVAYTQTDDNGQFTFENLPAGVYRISFEFPGIPLDETTFVEFEISEDDDRTSIELEALATEDGTIVVNDVTPDPVKVKEEISNLVKVYPNPSKDFIMIDFSQLSENEIVLKLIDNSGKTVLSRELHKGENDRVSIDVSIVGDGIYFMRFMDSSNGDSIGTLRFIKME